MKFGWSALLSGVLPVLNASASASERLVGTGVVEVFENEPAGNTGKPYKKVGNMRGFSAEASGTSVAGVATATNAVAALPGPEYTPLRGLNLPPTQGTTRDGAFFPGLYDYDYHPEHVGQAVATAGFSALRLAVNVETAMNPQALQKHKAYIDAAGGRGIICMFDTSSAPGTSWPRTGRVTGKVDAVAAAWRSVHAVFAPYGGHVLYELFNEPWGYEANATDYLADMLSVIRASGLPPDRVILAGLYGSADVQSVAHAGWSGYLAYHVYSFWLPEGNRTRQGFSALVQQVLANLSSRVFITEFGVGLNGLKANVDAFERNEDLARHADKVTFTGDWGKEHGHDVVNEDYHVICAKHPNNRWCKRKGRGTFLAQEPNLGADVAAQTGAATAGGAPVAHQEETVAFLQGVRDGLLALKKRGQGVRGLFHWHGWHNGDTWDFWDAANARSSRMIQMMMSDLGEGVTPEGEDPMSADYVSDDQLVHMVMARSLGPLPTKKCPTECAASGCLPGDPAAIGGKHLTGNFCTHSCSAPIAGWRYCGTGPSYELPGFADCGGCARPAMCAGLPCLPAPKGGANSTALLR